MLLTRNQTEKRKNLTRHSFQIYWTVNSYLKQLNAWAEYWLSSFQETFEFSGKFSLFLKERSPQKHCLWEGDCSGSLILLLFSEYFQEKGIFPEFPTVTGTYGTYKQIYVEVYWELCPRKTILPWKWNIFHPRCLRDSKQNLMQWSFRAKPNFSLDLNQKYSLSFCSFC